MATHSSILAWRIPWMEETGRLQSMALQRAGCDWAHMHTQRCSSILHIIVYTCQCYLLNLPHPLLPLLCPQLYSLLLHLHSFPANRLIGTVFLDSLCVCVCIYTHIDTLIHNICFCLTVLHAV